MSEYQKLSDGLVGASRLGVNCIDLGSRELSSGNGLVTTQAVKHWMKSAKRIPRHNCINGYNIAGNTHAAVKWHLG